MPLTKKGKKIKAAMTAEYGKAKGASVFYASRNKGTITGVDPESSSRRGARAARATRARV